MKWGEKRYYSLDYYLKHTYGEKLYKISLNGGMTCPVRDGALGTRGCIFCSEGGSGDFTSDSQLSITEQIEQGKKLVERKHTGTSYIAYFQAYTNTYAPLAYLKKIFREAIEHPDIRILSIATRPDCLGADIVELLSELNQIKPVWIELGLQTIHEETADFIRRGYSLPVFEKALSALRHAGIDVIVHTILGLPGEGTSQMLDTIRYLNTKDIQGVKLQLLHILKHTDLADYYEAHPFFVPSMKEYFELLGRCICSLRPDIVIHRLTGDGPKPLLIAPVWSADKRRVLNNMQRYFKEHDIWQGKEYLMIETFKLYKLIILYMLEQVDFPLTISQISDFLLDEGYTTYFKMQQAVAELLESGFIREESTHNRTFYHLTEEGAATVQYFKNDISPDIQKDIHTFLKTRKYELKNEVSVKSDYYPISSGEYAVRCQVIEKGVPLIDLTLTAPTQSEAETISNNWAKRNQQIYAAIMKELL